MKIGILTLPFNNNYGGYLQCYALMTILKQMGHDVELIYRKQNKRSLKHRIKLFVKNIIFVLNNKEVASIIPNIEKELRYKGQHMMAFVDAYLTPKTCPLYNTKKMNEFIENRYDAVVVGSDQIWRPEYVFNIRDFFLFGLKDVHIKRVAYAASFGTDNPIYTEEELNDCGMAITKFSAVSVREDSGIDIFKRFGWKYDTLQVVLDPTLLLSQDHYNGLLPKAKSATYGKICCYILDWSENKEQVVNYTSHNIGMEVSHIVDPIQRDHPNYKMPSIEEWLRAIRDSKMVITDSYHGTVFSIVFQKPFLFIGNTARGNARIESLLNLLEINPKNTQNINYDQVYNRMANLKNSSISFIERSLN